MNGTQAFEDIILFLNYKEPKGVYTKQVEIIKEELQCFEILISHIQNDLALYFNGLNQNEIDLIMKLRNARTIKGDN